MPKDFLWGRTVGHLKVTLLLLRLRYFLVLSACGINWYTLLAQCFFMAVFGKKAPRRGAALFYRPPLKYFIRHTS